MDTRKSSSSKNGAAKAAANGHPTTPPTPNHMMPRWALDPLCQSRNAAVPSMLKHMEKLLGRNAALAWNMPGLASSTIMNMTPTRGLNTLATFAYSRDSQYAVNSARHTRVT